MDQLDKKRAYDLFTQFKDQLSSVGSLNQKPTDRILLIDGLNTFIRCWSANPAMNEDGFHTGGISGFLKSMGFAIKMINPTRCIIIFDGHNNTVRRKKIYPEYKIKRSSKLRLNRTYEELASDDEENANKTRQLLRLVDYFQLLPITFAVIDSSEADDGIAYCALTHFNQSSVFIMSSDKDFLQLVNDRIKVWSPTKKKMYGIKEVIDDYGIHPHNFSLYRAMDGDSSDNVSGIKGAGTKTILKCFPFLEESEKRDLQYLIGYAEKNRGKYKLHDSVVENEDILKRNIELMQLNETILPPVTQLTLVQRLKQKVPRIDRFKLLKLINEDKLWDNIPNYQNWLSETFGLLDSMAEFNYEQIKKEKETSN